MQSHLLMDRQYNAMFLAISYLQSKQIIAYSWIEGVEG